MKMKLPQIKKRITDSIKASQEIGYTLVNSGWGSDKLKCACALGCVLLVEKGGLLPKNADEESSINSLATLFGVSPKWLWDFMDGFDHGYSGEDFPEASDMGCQIAKEFPSVNYDHFLNSLIKR
jgi:hypothetical protein